MQWEGARNTTAHSARAVGPSLPFHFAHAQTQSADSSFLRLQAAHAFFVSIWRELTEFERKHSLGNDDCLSGCNQKLPMYIKNKTKHCLHRLDLTVHPCRMSAASHVA